MKLEVKKKALNIGSTVMLLVLFWNIVALTAIGATDSGNPNNIVPLACGYGQNLVLKNNGDVWTWGDNWNGRLGYGTMVNRTSPIQIPNLSGITAVAAGQLHSLALKHDGTVWAWGYNNDGQLGNGFTDEYPSTVVQVQGLSEVTAIAVHGGRSMALKSDGSVWVWGDTSFSMHGDTRYVDHYIPVKVPNLNGITAIAAGGLCNLALKSNGTVWVWGINAFGVFGDGGNGEHRKRLIEDIPVQVPNLSDVIAIESGSTHNIALTSDGSVWTWGQNVYGELGDGTTNARFTPYKVPYISDVKAIATGGCHCLALKKDNSLWAWGSNWAGQLGDGSKTPQSIPVRVQGISEVMAFAAGNVHSMAIKNDGSVWSWGNNYSGQLGDGTTINQTKPVPVLTSDGGSFLSDISY